MSARTDARKIEEARARQESAHFRELEAAKAAERNVLAAEEHGAALEAELERERAKRAAVEAQLARTKELLDRTNRLLEAERARPPLAAELVTSDLQPFAVPALLVRELEAKFNAQREAAKRLNELEAARRKLGDLVDLEDALRDAEGLLEDLEGAHAIGEAEAAAVDVARQARDAAKAKHDEQRKAGDYLDRSIAKQRAAVEHAEAAASALGCAIAQAAGPRLQERFGQLLREAARVRATYLGLARAAVRWGDRVRPRQHWEPLPREGRAKYLSAEGALVALGLAHALGEAGQGFREADLPTFELEALLAWPTEPDALPGPEAA